MSRSQDTVIDDDEETCPLCIEEFDLSDKNFRPCPCGYQICQFCFNSLKTTYEKSTCPNCRRPYDEKTIQYKIPTAEEFKLDQLNKNKKQAAAKRKETEKREVENSSRRNLAGVRVKQQNLVYVIGLIPSIKDEQALLQTLRGPEYFGQYGEIEKIVVSKAKPGAPNQGIGVYVTYARKEDAALCINTVDGSLNGDRVLRAQFGTTKYCSAYLRGETCTNKNCSFLHETGEDGQHTSLQNEPHGARISRPAVPSTQTTQMNPPARPLSAAQTATSQSMARQGSKENDDSRKNSQDGSALPSTASWATANANVVRTRRTSQSNSRATPSPQITHASLTAQKLEESKAKEPAVTQPSPSTAPTQTKSASVSDRPTSKARSTPTDPAQQIFDDVKRILLRTYQFTYDDSCLSPEARASVDDMPCFVDPYGGAKRRAMREREEAERAKLEADAKAKLEAQATSAAEETLEEDNIVAGSLALGGEPEDDPRSSSARGAIGRPTQSLQDQFSSMNLNGRSLTPQQRQQLALLNTTNVQQAPGLSLASTQNTAFEMSDFDRRGPQFSQAQYEQISNHQRHGSRYFNNDSKAATGSRFQGQQQGFYSSGVQGPPPGLPTAGTPPVSGGGMFAHGQNFTNPGFGASKDVNTEVYTRARSGTNQGHEMAKPPAPGVLNPLYAQYPTYQDPGLVKQRKKGKKHRHANTSSSGGGVEHLADPSVASTRVHQSNTPGQGLFGGNQVDEKNFPPLPVRPESSQFPPLHSRVSSFQSFQGAGLRSATPKVPPGFELTHAHPAPQRQESPSPAVQPVGQRSTSAVSIPVAPAVPLIPLGPRTSPPKPKPLDGAKEEPKDDQSATKAAHSAHDSKNGAAEISLGSPKQKTIRHKPKVEGKLESTDKVDEKSEGKGKEKAVMAKPEKIDLPSAVPPNVSATTAALDKSTTPVLESSVIGTPGTMSRSATPPATTPEPAKGPMPRPRALRITTGMMAKVADQTPGSATAEKSSFIPPSAAKRGSRRPSLSSAQQSRPSTPAMSERLSHDASRASSPPPSIIGSAPERTKTKAQQKKERKEKARKTTEVSEAVSASSTPVVEDVAPVIARQKKQKKQRIESSTATTVDDIANPDQVKDYNPAEVTGKQTLDSHTENAEITPEQKETAASSSSTKAGKLTPQLQQPSTPVPGTPKGENLTNPMSGEPNAPYTVRDLYNYASKLVESDGDNTATHAAIQKLLQEHLSSVPKIISSLLQSGDLTKDHPWLNPPSFNSAAYKLAPDSRRGQEYLDGNAYSANDAFGHLYLPLKQKQELKDGQSVSIVDVGEGEGKVDLLKRCLITPNGWVLRHLNQEESDKLVELDDRRQMYVEEFGDVGTMSGLGVLEPDDFTNLGGGLERLTRHGERHGVVWIVGEDGQMDDDDDEFEPFDDEDGELGVGGELVVSDDELDDDGYDDEEGLDEDDGGFDGSATDEHLSMPGAWEHPPRDPHHNNTRVSSGGRLNSLPGLGPHSRTNTFRLQARGPSFPPDQPFTNPPLRTRASNLTSDMPAAPPMTTTTTSSSSAAATAGTPPVEALNLRALEPEALQRRMAEAQKALEAARKEMDKIEKMANKKTKDINRWREGILNGVGIKG